MKKTSIMLIAALAAVSVQATLIDFESPTYSGSSGGVNLNGQDGWVSPASGSTRAYVFNNSPLGGDQFVRLYATLSNAERDMPAADFANTTHWSFRAGRYGSDNTGNARLGTTSSSDDTVAWVYFNPDNGIGGFENGGFNGYLLAWNPNDDYKIDVTVNFTTQTYDLTVNNQTLGTSGSSTGISFRNAKTLSDFSGGGNMYYKTQYAGMYLDDIEVIPEPATLGLLGSVGAGLLFIRRKFML